MSSIGEIEDKITELYQGIEEQPQVDVPISVLVAEWISFSETYLLAAVAIDNDKPQCWLPKMQIIGQAVESSIKTCMASVGIKPPHGHDLIGLFKECEKMGFNLDDSDLAAIVHLSHLYYKDLSTETKYKTRYPAKGNESLGGVVPAVDVYISLTKSLHEQANKRLEQ